MSDDGVGSAESVGFATERDGGVLILTFNRPAQGNSLKSEAVPLLTALFQSLPADPDVRALLIRGEGRMFSGGGDVRGFMETLKQSPEARRADYGARLGRVTTAIEAFIALDLPIVTACQGAVAGAGMTYALGADLVLADETVNFAFVHQRIGLPPDGGISVLLPRAVGERKAAELILTAGTVKADEALRLGLVSRLVPAAELQEEALKAAHRFAQAPRDVIRRSKRLLAGALLRPAADQLEAERQAIIASVGEPDFEEGVTAFIEKRKAVFPSSLR